MKNNSKRTYENYAYRAKTNPIELPFGTFMIESLPSGSRYIVHESGRRERFDEAWIKRMEKKFQQEILKEEMKRAQEIINENAEIPNEPIPAGS